METGELQLNWEAALFDIIVLLTKITDSPDMNDPGSIVLPQANLLANNCKDSTR